VPLLLSIQVGMPVRHDPPGRPWRTGFFKYPVNGPVWLGTTNLVGDGQGNLKVHGGPDKAVLAYAASHYPAWRAELDMPNLPYGAFAENFTVDGLDEHSVCIGDIYSIGSTRLEVSQPRRPCGNISRRWQRKDLTGLVDDTGRTGWYLRVLQPGHVEPGQDIVLMERPHPRWTIDYAAAVMKERPRPEAAELARLPQLSVAWRATIDASLASAR
jgi:MOSC domain-containing protein YiiM